MKELENIEQQLWEYIDGLSSNDEKSFVEKMIATNKEWQEKYGELLELQQLVKSTSLEEPSLRFTKNVMEGISRLQIAPAAKNYINNKIIWGIAIFFLTLIIGFLIYGFGQVDWSAKTDRRLPVDFSQVDYSKFFNNTYVNIFMMLNVVLGLVLLDRYLSMKRKKLKEGI